MRRLGLVLVVGILASAPSARAEPSDPWVALPLALEEPLLPPEPEGHEIASLAALGGIYGAVTVWAYYAWYHDFEGHEFAVGGDGYFGRNRYAGGADKLGHAWANLVLTRGSTQLLRWGGWDRVPAALIAGGLAAGYFAFIEIKDGYYYEMSPGDLIGNTLGAALGVVQEISPRFDELVDFRVEYWPSDEYRAIVRGDAEAEINSINIAEDYSGQTYLLALHLGAFEALDRTRISRYLDVALGFRADNYKPDPLPEDEVVPDQRLFLGLSLNLQGIVDDVLDGKPRTVLHGFSEVMNLPFTSVGVVDATRSATP